MGDNFKKMTYSCILSEDLRDTDTKSAIERHANDLLNHYSDALTVLLAGGSINVTHDYVIYDVRLSYIENSVFGTMTKPSITYTPGDGTTEETACCTMYMSVMPLGTVVKNKQ